jgi:hypothetical protein
LLFEAIEELGDKGFLPKLRKQLNETKREKGINADWLERLKSCIEALEVL